jgi:hypothetical protein
LVGFAVRFWGRFETADDMAGTWLDDPETAEDRCRPYLFGLIAVATVLGVFVTKDVMEAASTLIIIFTAIVCWRIFKVRRRQATDALRDPARIWALIAFGFAFLALDEIFSIHEKIDEFLHWILSIEQTYLTDRFDDVIIVLYGIVGLILLYWHRDEFRSLPGFVPYLAVGFFFLLVMTVFDVISDSSRLVMLVADPNNYQSVKRAAAIIEELAKLISEAAFVLGFLRAHRHIAARRATAAGELVAGSSAAPKSLR